MKRRSFLSSSVIASLGLPLLSFDPLSREKTAGINSASEEFELSEATIDMLQEYMRSRKYSSKKITQLYLERIRNLDKSGPYVNSIIEVNPDAQSIAESMDKETDAGKNKGTHAWYTNTNKG